jgi:hypothetical protein
MGCSYEINDTLLLTKAQGFPSDILDIEKHQREPITIDAVDGMMFEFAGKPAARAFQLDPVRVFLFERTPNDKWLGWGHVLIEELTIVRRPELPPSDPSKPIFDAGQWLTSGKFRIITLYDPEYQKIFTTHESPAAWNYFAGT